MRHRRSASLALLAAVVVGLALVPTAGASADVVAPALDGGGTTSSDQLLPSGTVATDDSDGRNIRVAVYAGTDMVNEISSCTTHVTGDPGPRAWQCDAPVDLAIGLNTLIAVNSQDSDLFTVSAESNHVQITRYGLDVVTIDPVPDSSDTTPTFSGTGPALGTVEVRSTNAPFETFCTATVNADSNWSCTSIPLDVGPHALRVSGRVLLSEEESSSTLHGLFFVEEAKVSYHFAPASVQVTIDGAGSAGGLGLGLYHVTVVDDGGVDYQYGPPLYGCPALVNGEGPEIGFTGTVETCTFSALEPGIWNLYTRQGEAGPSYYRNDFVLIPQTPTIALVVNSDRTVAASGTGTPGYLVIVQTPGGDAACQAAVSGAGTWACTLSPGSGEARYRAVQQSQGFAAASEASPDSSYQGYSAYTSTASVIVPPVSAPRAPVSAPRTPTVNPSPTPVPPTWSLDFGDDEFEPGDETDLTGSGLPPGSFVEAWLHSTPILLGSTVAGADGTFSLHVVIPAVVEPGAHKFVVIVTPPREAAATVEQPVTVTAVTIADSLEAVQTSVEPEPEPELGPVGDPRNDPAAPSSLTHALHSVRDAFRNPVVLAGAGAAGFALLIFIALPAELLNSTFSEQYGRFTRRLPKLKRLTLVQRFSNWVKGSKLAVGAVLTFLAALIFGFADPDFGFDLTSLRVVVACGIGLFVVGYLASAISGLIIHRRWQLASVIELKPLGLLLTVLGVLLSRVLDFSPGFLLGLIIGLAITSTMSDALKAKTALLQVGVVFALSMLAWVAYSLLSGQVDADSLGGSLLLDALVATTTEGLTAVFVGMLPFRFLDGEPIFRYNKLLWGLSYLVAATSFVLVIALSSRSWGEIGEDLWLWVSVLGGFALVSFGVWAYFRWWAPGETEDESEQQPAERTAR
ncbi:hypothetical protein BH09ACT3_BH09ACT3_07120 [soil metagenome]